MCVHMKVNSAFVYELSLTGIPEGIGCNVHIVQMQIKKSTFTYLHKQ